MAVEAAANRKVIIQLDAIDHQRGTVVHIDIKKSRPLKSLMDGYLSRLCLQPSQAYFVTDGEHVAPNDTAEKLGLEDGDFIDVGVT